MDKKIFVLFALLLACCLLVISCAPDAEPDAEPDEQPEEVIEGGILTIASSTDAQNLGYPTTMALMYDIYFARTSLETLLRFDEELNLAPGLAEDWDEDPDNKTITLFLREGVKFHDGSYFNADVAKWNLDTYRESPRTELNLIDSIDVIDDYTLQINLTEYDQGILNTLVLQAGFIISKEAVEANGVDWAEKNPVGTGPFKFVKWERDVEQVYTRFDDYWQDGKPIVDEVRWVPIADPIVRMASLRNNEVDIVMDLEPKDAGALEAGGFKTHAVPSSLYGLAPDSNNPNSPLADIKVRQALEHAIDKEAICQAIGYGYWNPIYQTAIPGSWAENPNLIGYRYDLAKAHQLLEEAGYPDPGELEITIYSPNSPQYLVDMVTAVHGYLEEFGVKVKMDIMEHARFGAYFTGQDDWVNGYAVIPMGISPDERALMNRLFLPASILIPATYKAPEFQEKLKEISQEPDFETRRKLMWEAQKILIEDNAMVTWIASPVSLEATSPKVHDHGYDIFGGGSHWNPAGVWIEQ